MQNKEKKEIGQNKNRRTLTVSTLHYETSYLRIQIVPFIRLSGKWLEEAEFKAGTKIEIIVMNKILVIKSKKNRY